MARIDGFPEHSMTGQLLAWGRSNSYVPSLLPSSASEADLRRAQEALFELDADVKLTKKLHATLLFCPPNHLLEAIKAQTGRAYSIQDEALFYADVANGLGTMTLFPPRADSIPTEGVEVFDKEYGTVVVRLAQTALLSEWRQTVRDLMEYNLRSYHGVTKEHSDVLAQDPQLTWLFNPSAPHITLANGYTGQSRISKSLPIPEAVELAQLAPKSPSQFLGARSLLFDVDKAFDDER